MNDRENHKEVNNFSEKNFKGNSALAYRQNNEDLKESPCPHGADSLRKKSRF